MSGSSISPNYQITSSNVTTTLDDPSRSIGANVTPAAHDINGVQNFLSSNSIHLWTYNGAVQAQATRQGFNATIGTTTVPFNTLTFLPVTVVGATMPSTTGLSPFFFTPNLSNTLQYNIVLRTNGVGVTDTDGFYFGIRVTNNVNHTFGRTSLYYPAGTSVVQNNTSPICGTVSNRITMLNSQQYGVFCIQTISSTPLSVTGNFNAAVIYA
ncbi:MAG: hypothetical protein IPL23_22235 [Saprospiraceae bacterium]|nr:hypothetical protein [Saprospiraceae bacterium]